MKKILTFILGFFLGSAFAAGGGWVAYKILRRYGSPEVLWEKVQSRLPQVRLFPGRSVMEEFTAPLTAQDGKSFGKENQLTFELFRGGQFVIDGVSGLAWQKSGHYGDSAIIRSTKALPRTYKISVVAGVIDYGLEKIEGLELDPQYPEGPKNENGCYLISIVDEAPTGHYINLWWHQHRKLVMDVDNNVWGHGAPNPLFVVYFDKDNSLVSWDGQAGAWNRDWRKAVTYQPDKYYRLELEKTAQTYIFSISEEGGRLLARSEIPIKDVWHGESHPEYFVIGDPHENYYTGSMKIKSLTIPAGKN